MAHSTFGERIGYANWLYHLRHGRTPKATVVAKAVQRSSVAVGAWATAENPPPHYEVHVALSAFFEIDERWLIRDEGEPPRAELWKVWLAARRTKTPARKASSVTKHPGATPGTASRARAAAVKRRASGQDET